MNLKNPLSWLSNGFGSGLSPLAPGTAGSFLALLIYYFLFYGNIGTFKWHILIRFKNQILPLTQIYLT